MFLKPFTHRLGSCLQKICDTDAYLAAIGDETDLFEDLMRFTSCEVVWLDVFFQLHGKDMDPRCDMADGRNLAWDPSVLHAPNYHKNTFKCLVLIFGTFQERHDKAQLLFILSSTAMPSLRLLWMPCCCRFKFYITSKFCHFLHCDINQDQLSKHPPNHLKLLMGACHL